MSVAATNSAGVDRSHRRVIFAASLGTVFEWYDFYLYGSLAGVIGKQFFAGVNDTTAFILALLAFSAGFAVRPLGALIFGRLGDLIGRKYTFLVTIVIMGAATALVGVLPTYASIGVAAPIILVGLRMLQGLAIGGEYGGAATYIAEHAPPGKRGYYTSWIQTTATLGLIMSLLVILGSRAWFGEAFETVGWRVPFLTSLILLAISIYIRLQLNESPVFREMQSEKRLSKQPIAESFGRWGNLRVVLLALFGAVAGQATVAYCGLIYMGLFLEQTLKVDGATTNLLVAAALAITTPFFIVLGKLSDRIGRKPLIMIGFALAAVGLFPLFKGLTHYANPAIEAAAAGHPVVVVADPNECSFQFDPIGKTLFTTSCDVAKTALASARIPYSNEIAPPGAVAIVRVGTATIESFDGTAMSAADFKSRSAEFNTRLKALLADAGYPNAADPTQTNYPMLLLLLTLIALYGPLVYASQASWLVELFPARIRYTSMSLPYHIGNGWFGGFLPTIAFALIAYTGNIYQGIWYPVAMALVSLVIGGLFLRETKGVVAEETS
jgi:MFS-type transporter involved in bile tolerance (Atg22 family)